MLKYIVGTVFLIFFASCTGNEVQKDIVTQEQDITQTETGNEKETEETEMLLVNFSNEDFQAFDEVPEPDPTSFMDDKLYKSNVGYTCENINEYLDGSFAPNVVPEYCGVKDYKGDTIIYFIFNEGGYESTSQLGYRIYVIRDDVGYTDYRATTSQAKQGMSYSSIELIPGLKHLSDEQQKQIEIIKGGEEVYFASEKYTEMSQYIDDTLSSDFENNAPWIQEQFNTVESYVNTTFQ